MRHNLRSRATLVTILSVLVGILGTPAGVFGATNQVPPLTSIGTGLLHVCGISKGGEVSCAGANNWGQLGDGTTKDSTSAVSVTGVNDAIQVDGGGQSTCVLRVRGLVTCWGDNRFGLIGTGTFDIDQQTNRVPADGISDATQISIEAAHICALQASGRVMCWGNNSDGQLGNGKPTGDSDQIGVSRPVSVIGISDATQIGTGAYFSCALLRDQSVRCWGGNDQGQLGDGTQITRATPVKVRGLENVKKISVGSFHACALLADANVMCWGSNSLGALGIRGPKISNTPVVVDSLGEVADINATAYHSCAIKKGGTPTCWGGYRMSTRRDPINFGMETNFVPRTVNGVPRTRAVGGGSGWGCALTAAGQLRCWGDNEFGQFGNGTKRRTRTAVLAFESR
jgi:alpha-tubulin suppressor-like RCC1 family protein